MTVVLFEVKWDINSNSVDKIGQEIMTWLLWKVGRTTRQRHDSSSGKQGVTKSWVDGAAAQDNGEEQPAALLEVTQ